MWLYVVYMYPNSANNLLSHGHSEQSYSQSEGPDPGIGMFDNTTVPPPIPENTARSTTSTSSCHTPPMVQGIQELTVADFSALGDRQFSSGQNEVDIFDAGGEVRMEGELVPYSRGSSHRESSHTSLHASFSSHQDGEDQGK